MDFNEVRMDLGSLNKFSNSLESLKSTKTNFNGSYSGFDKSDV